VSGDYFNASFGLIGQNLNNIGTESQMEIMLFCVTACR